MASYRGTREIYEHVHRARSWCNCEHIFLLLDQDIVVVDRVRRAQRVLRHQRTDRNGRDRDCILHLRWCRRNRRWGMCDRTRNREHFMLHQVHCPCKGMVASWLHGDHVRHGVCKIIARCRVRRRRRACRVVIESRRVVESEFVVRVHQSY